MTPFLRLSLSLSLTLAVWGPNAVEEFGNGAVHLTHLLFRFVVTFAFFRVSMWGVSALIDSYRLMSQELGTVVAVPSAAALDRRRAPEADQTGLNGSHSAGFPSGLRNSLES